jgi:hypothetical protein
MPRLFVEMEEEGDPLPQIAAPPTQMNEPRPKWPCRVEN